MKQAIIIILMLVVVATSMSCKKSIDAVQLDGGMINVTNAIIGGPRLNMMSPNAVLSSSNTINNNGFAIMPVLSGQQTLSFGLPPVAATTTAAAVPATVYYTQNVAVDNTTNCSLFLTGTGISAIENVLIKETYQRTYADSVCGVRFINLSPGNSSISVNIKGSANGSEVSSLAYKAYNDFKQYTAKRANPNYIFEFRDAASGTLLASFTMTTPYFHNVTLCLRGKTGAYGVIQDNDY